MMRFRLATAADLPACAALLASDARFVCSAAVRESLRTLWRSLLDTDGAPRPSFVVWEDLQRPEAERIQGFSLGLFLRGSYVDAELAQPQPYVAARVYEQMLRGERPHLTVREIARSSNAGDLHLVLLHYVQRHYDLTHPDNVVLNALGPASWHYSYAGYRMRRILWEVYGKPHLNNMLGWGFEAIHAFADPDTPDAHRQPFWCALERRDVKPAAFDAMSVWVFHPPKPVLRLAPAEQRVVLHALQGDTDQAVADELQVSRDAVKQAWRRIVERVAPVLPPTDKTPTTVRGAERRRVALDYLRQHMEELRPWSEP